MLGLYPDACTASVRTVLRNGFEYQSEAIQDRALTYRVSAGQGWRDAQQLPLVLLRPRHVTVQG